MAGRGASEVLLDTTPPSAWNPDLIRALQLLIPSLDLRPPISTNLHAPIRGQVNSLLQYMPTRAALLLEFHCAVAGYKPVIELVPEATFSAADRLSVLVRESNPATAIVARVGQANLVHIITLLGTNMVLTNPITRVQLPFKASLLPQPAFALTFRTLSTSATCNTQTGS